MMRVIDTHFVHQIGATMLLINTSIKRGNNTGRAIQQVVHYLRSTGQEFNVASMVSFAAFTGEYLTSESQLPGEAVPLLRSLETHADHIYFVPTYYKMMPGAFKNFLDITRIASAYNGKRIGIVATNAKNQDYGARQFLQTLFGLLEFHKAVSVVIPQIPILNPEQINTQDLQDYLDYFSAFPQPNST